MADLMRSNPEDTPLFRQRQSTSTLAGEQAARAVGSWRQRILARLQDQPSTLWEVAQYFSVPDHVISGRFSELAKDGYIEHAGARRPHPISQCDAEVWRIRRDRVEGVDPAELLGYPATVILDGEIYDRHIYPWVSVYPFCPITVMNFL